MLPRHSCTLHLSRVEVSLKPVGTKNPKGAEAQVPSPPLGIQGTDLLAQYEGSGELRASLLASHPQVTPSHSTGPARPARPPCCPRGSPPRAGSRAKVLPQPQPIGRIPLHSSSPKQEAIVFLIFFFFY